MGAYEQWNKLNPNEKLAIAQWPALGVAVPETKDKAFAETTKRFGFNGRNDKSDAFRHCYWSALLTRDVGFLAAYSFTTAHEDFPSNPAAEKAMDLHNNMQGMVIGISHKGSTNDTLLSDACYSALAAGKLKVITP